MQDGNRAVVTEGFLSLQDGYTAVIIIIMRVFSVCRIDTELLSPRVFSVFWMEIEMLSTRFSSALSSHSGSTSFSLFVPTCVLAILMLLTKIFLSLQSDSTMQSSVCCCCFVCVCCQSDSTMCSVMIFVCLQSDSTMCSIMIFVCLQSDSTM